MRNVARKGDPTSTGGMIQEGGEPAEFGKNRTLRFSGHP